MSRRNNPAFRKHLRLGLLPAFLLSVFFIQSSVYPLSPPHQTPEQILRGTLQVLETLRLAQGEIANEAEVLAAFRALDVLSHHAAFDWVGAINEVGRWTRSKNLAIEMSAIELLAKLWYRRLLIQYRNLLETKKLTEDGIRAAHWMGRLLAMPGFEPSVLEMAATLLLAGRQPGSLLALVVFEHELDGYRHADLKAKIQGDLWLNREWLRAVARDLAAVYKATEDLEIKSASSLYLRLVVSDYFSEREELNFINQVFEGTGFDAITEDMNLLWIIGDVKETLIEFQKAAAEGKPIDREAFRTFEFWRTRVRKQDAFRATLALRYWVKLELAAERRVESKAVGVLLEAMFNLWKEEQERRHRKPVPGEKPNVLIIRPTLPDTLPELKHIERCLDDKLEIFRKSIEALQSAS